MTDQKQSASDAIANHIAGLEQEIEVLNLTLEATRDEMNQRAVEAATSSADVRLKTAVVAGMQKQLAAQHKENATLRRDFMTTSGLIQEQQNKTRTELEQAQRELAAERTRPIGSSDFILYLIVTQAASYLNKRFVSLCLSRAFQQKSFSHLKALVMDVVSDTGGQIDLPFDLQEIVKTYCATTRTAFDSDALLADVSNYVESNATAILEMESIQELFKFRQDLRDNQQAERMVHQHVRSVALPDAVYDFLSVTSSNYLFERDQHHIQLLNSVKEIAVSFIEDISFEIPISLE